MVENPNCSILLYVFGLFDLFCLIVYRIISKIYVILRRLLVKFLKYVVMIGILVWLFTSTNSSWLGLLFPSGNNFVERLNDSVKHYELNCRNINRHGPHPDTFGNSPPFDLGNQTRYIGEDAKFVCSALITGYNTSKPHVNQVAWKKDGEHYVRPDNRHFISWTFERYRKSETHNLLVWFNITTILQIDVIEEEDFGVYNCYISARTNYLPIQTESKPKTPKQSKNQTQYYCKYTCKCDHQKANRENGQNREDIELLFLLVNDLIWNAEFRLLKEEPQTKTLFIAPGNLLSIATYYRHLADTHDITIYYTLNDKEVHNVQSRCSWFVLAYYVVFQGHFISLSNVTNFEMSLNEWKTSVSLMMHCIGPNSYGIYDIVILRRVVNSKDGKEYIREFNHPLKLDIKPKESTLFSDPKTNDTETWSSTFDINCWNTDQNSRPSICNTIDFIVQTISDNVQMVETNIFFKLVLFVVFFVLACEYVILFMYYKLRFVIINFRYRPQIVQSVECLANLQKHEDADKRHHVYVSYVGNDEPFVKRTILPVLKEFGVNVFDRRCDIQLGSLKNIEISKAINQSLTVIVIASLSYVQNRERNTYEISIILQNCSTTNLLIVKIDDCCVHKVFENQYTLIEWSKKELLKENTSRFYKWIHTNFLYQTLCKPLFMGFRAVELCIDFLFHAYHTIK